MGTHFYELGDVILVVVNVLQNRATPQQMCFFFKDQRTIGTHPPTHPLGGPRGDGVSGGREWAPGPLLGSPQYSAVITHYFSILLYYL